MPNLIANVGELALGEAEANIAHELVEEAFPPLVAGSLNERADSALHHRVLAHEDHAVRADARAHVLELLRSHVVHMDDEGAVVLLFGGVGKTLKRDTPASIPHAVSTDAARTRNRQMSFPANKNSVERLEAFD